MTKKKSQSPKPHRHHKNDKNNKNPRDFNGGKKSNLYDEDTFPASDPITKY